MMPGVSCLLFATQPTSGSYFACMSAPRLSVLRLHHQDGASAFKRLLHPEVMARTSGGKREDMLYLASAKISVHHLTIVSMHSILCDAATLSLFSFSPVFPYPPLLVLYFLSFPAKTCDAFSDPCRAASLHDKLLFPYSSPLHHVYCCSMPLCPIDFAVTNRS